jgi:hypothetical protein
VVRVHPELQGQFLLLLGMIGFLLLLALTGASEELVIAFGIAAGFIFLVLWLIGGAPAQYEIVEEKRGNSSEATSRSEYFGDVESTFVPTAASGELRRAVGDPLATELHDIETELLEQAANGRLPAKDVARLAQQFAKNRTELIQEGTAAADKTATGQPDSDQMEH